LKQEETIERGEEFEGFKEFEEFELLRTGVGQTLHLAETHDHPVLPVGLATIRMEVLQAWRSS
jgi:hypothetical protein